MAIPAISVNNLNYYYPGKKALDDVTFEIETGSITALVGPNGAGKSTLLRCLAALDSPFSGKLSVAGVDITDDQRLAHTKIGYLSDDFGLYNDLNVREVLEFVAGCHNLAEASRINAVIQKLRLNSVETQKCGTLSRGWRQRVGIALSILHKPDVLILDEPASGLDPEARAELSSILKSLQADGMTIIVSSHILAELEEYCTAMLVLRDGRIHDHVTLASHQRVDTVSILVSVATPLSVDDERAITSLSSETSCFVLPDRMAIQITAPVSPSEHHKILKTLLEQNIAVCGFAVRSETLQNLYLEIAKTSEAEKV